MATRDTQKLKELVFEALNNDSTLQTLLGGSGKVKHGYPLQYAEYPCVVYSIIAEQDTPYNEDIVAGITRTRLAIQVFSSSDSSEEVDQIEDQIYALLHGNRLSNADFVVYTCYRVARTPLYEPEAKVWRIEARYDLVNVAL